MKYSTVALLASSGFAGAASLPMYMGHPVDPKYLPESFKEKRQMIGNLVGGALNTPGYGKVAAPAGSAPKRVTLQPRIPTAKTVKVRYGPYKIPNASIKNRASGHTGTIYNLPDVNVPTPCNDCTLVGWNAGLEFPNGDNANIDKGLWLHHYVHFVTGPGREDATCKGRISLPHTIIGSTPGSSERFFSSGNERSVVKPDPGPLKYGYYLSKSDKMSLIVDLMNETEKDEIVFLTVTYDYVEGKPANLDQVRPVWFDANQCGTSEVKPPKQSGSFVISARPWTANFAGEVIKYAGHLHDGGVSVDMEVNGKSQCKSVAKYGETPEYVSKHSHGGAGGEMKHISSMTLCEGKGLASGTQLKVGDKWTLKGYYDYDKFPGSKHGGGQDDIMGIAIMYVQLPKGASAAKGA